MHAAVKEAFTADLERVEVSSVARKVQKAIGSIEKVCVEMAEEGGKWMDSGEYKEKVLREKGLGGYCRLITNQILG